MKVSINLVTWNGARYIKNCLESVFQQTFTDFDLLIIDNGSTDETVELIKERFPHLQVVQHKENFGFAKAHNQAIHWSKGEYVLALNQDIVLEPDFLKQLVEFMDRHPLVGAVTGKLLKLQNNDKTNYIDSVGLQIYKNHRVIDLGAGEVDEGQYNAIEEVFGVSGALPLYRRKALASVEMEKQFFDDDFFSYKEDIDLAYRLRYAGWQAYKVPTAIAYHDRSVSAATKDMTKLQVAQNRKQKSGFANYLSFRNHWYFLIKDLPQFKFKYFWPVFWYELIKFFYVLFFETRNLKALSQVWKNRKRFINKRKVILGRRKIGLEEIDKWLV